MLLRRVARPLLAAIFVSGGIDELLNPKQKVAVAGPLIEKSRQVLPVNRLGDPGTIVQVDSAVKVAAGLMLAFGKAPRLAATALAASLIPTTVAAHPFWEAHAEERKVQQAHFFTNVGLLGGLLLATADTHGKPSVAERSRRAKKQAARTAKVARKSAKAGRKGAKALR